MSNINEPKENGKTTVFCTQCGKENQIENSFCIYCGANIGASENNQTVAEQGFIQEEKNASIFNSVGSIVKTPLSLRQYISVALIAIAALMMAFGSFIKLNIKFIDQVLKMIDMSGFSLEAFGIKTKYSLSSLGKLSGDIYSMLALADASEGASILLTIKAVIIFVLIIIFILSCLTIILLIAKKEKWYRLTNCFLIGLATLIPIIEFALAKKINDRIAELIGEGIMGGGSSIMDIMGGGSSAAGDVASIIGMGTSMIDLKLIKISAFTILPLILLLVVLFLTAKIDKPLLSGGTIGSVHGRNMRNQEQMTDMYVPYNSKEIYSPGKYSEGAGEYVPGKYSTEESKQTDNRP